MKYEDLKCEFCDGKGEKEKFVEPYGDSPVTCTFCNGTGIDQDQLKKLSPYKELLQAIDIFIIADKNSPMETSILTIHQRKEIELLLSKSKL